MGQKLSHTLLKQAVAAAAVEKETDAAIVAEREKYTKKSQLMNRHVDAEMYKHEIVCKAADNGLIDSNRMIMLMYTTLMTPTAFEYFKNEKVAAINRQADRKLKEVSRGGEGEKGC